MKISGVAGWVGLALYVAVWDYYMEDTLSGAFARGWRHPLRRWPVLLVWCLTTLHLFDRIPEAYDPFDMIGRAVKRRVLPAS